MLFNDNNFAAIYISKSSLIKETDRSFIN